LGRKSLYAPRLPLLFSLLVKLGDLLDEYLGRAILFAAVTLELNERKQAIELAVLGFAVGEARQPPEPSPVRSAWIGIVAIGKRLCCESSDGFWQHSGVLEPGLEVAGAGLNDAARIEAIRYEPRQRSFVEIVEHGETMLP
jgi:hypothetical protein